MAHTDGTALAVGNPPCDPRGGRRQLRAYRFHPGEALPDAVRRVARGRIDHALGQLGAKADGDRERAIHEARKDMKKLRSLVRLVRGELGDKAYRRENEAFREAGRRLSTARDAEVLLLTLERLEGSPELGLASKGHTELRRELERRRASVLAEAEVEQSVSEVRSALRKARRRIKSWSLAEEGLAATEPGLRRSYRRGRRALRAVEQDPTPEALHEWRKRVKDLWYQLRLLAEVEPRVADLIEQADVLAELLGEDHDLVVLGATAEWSAGGNAGGELKSLQRAIKVRRDELQAKALTLGREMYADAPRTFTQQLGGLCQTVPAIAE